MIHRPRRTLQGLAVVVALLGTWAAASAGTATIAPATAAAPPAADGGSPAGPPRPRVVAYVPNWIDVEAFADTIDYPKLTHINLAFANPTNDDGDLSFSAKNNALIAKAKAAGVKVLISIGGGAASGDKVLLKRYAALLADPVKRAGFVLRAEAYLAAHGLDGLDVDIEGPAITAGYGECVADLAKALKPKGKLLTAALSKGYGGDRVPDSVFADFDFVNIMAYDGTGPWNPDKPGQHASMQYAKDSVAYWVGRGLPKDKAVLGVPFYGYGFGEAFRKRDYPYSAIVAAHPGAEDADEAGSTVYYNGLTTIRAKSQYVVEEKLGGVMIWSLDYDVTGERSLLTAVHKTLTAASPSGAAATRPAVGPPIGGERRPTRQWWLPDASGWTSGGWSRPAARPRAGGSPDRSSGFQKSGKSPAATVL